MSASAARPLLAIAESVSANPDMALQTPVLLARQALERAVAEYWRIRCPGVERSPRGIQMLCLYVFLDDEDLAIETRATWKTLSAFSHHHPYEPPPSARELDHALKVIRRFVEHVERQAAR